MIVSQFLRWIETAPAGTRADATFALAQSYLLGELSPSDRGAAEAAMIFLLDDPSPLVRCALAEALGSSPKAPHSIVISLAYDQPEVAHPILSRSPVLSLSELVELVATGDVRCQMSIAERLDLPASIAGALAEVGSLHACLALIENETANMTPTIFDRIAVRFASEPHIRAALLSRDDLPLNTRHRIVLAVSSVLTSFVAGRQWIAEDRALRVKKEACEKAAVTLASQGSEMDVGALVRHLRRENLLNTGLMLRAVLSQNIRFIEEALADLAEIPVSRVAWLLAEPRSAAFRALFDRAGLPSCAFLAFRSSLEAINERGFIPDHEAGQRLSRTMVERVLTAYDKAPKEDIDQLFGLLRRFYAEAARDEARKIVEQMAA
jgi:uncharacterized protein (DUF2336 family)